MFQQHITEWTLKGQKTLRCRVPSLQKHTMAFSIPVCRSVGGGYSFMAAETQMGARTCLVSSYTCTARPGRVILGRHPGGHGGGWMATRKQDIKKILQTEKIFGM